MLREDAFGPDYLRERISREFAIAAHIGITVESADDSGIVLRAPLIPNANDKGTAFGGSLFALAVLTGWTWLARYLAQHALEADAVIQESNIRYLTPVNGDFRATLTAPTSPEIAQFRKVLRRAARARIRLLVDLTDGPTLAAQFEGWYVAAARA
ncbi:MAG: YiiD C-terminal domain-containing protein [Steroidobacteraceae bacterium]|jgi:thioesterase domain-containing protein